MYKHFLLLHVACRMLCSKNALNYVDYARDLLQKFILISKELYGPEFVVMNVHSLQHIPDDVQNMQCNLNYITAFPFEIFLGKIKNTLRSPHNVAPQLARRMHEKKLCLNEKPSLPSIEILQQTNEEIKKLKYKQITITTKSPDNTVILNNKNICRIKKIYVTDGIFKANVDIMKVKDFVYTYPCNSANVDIYELNPKPASTDKSILINTISTKLMILKPNKENTKVFALELLH